MVGDEFTSGEALMNLVEVHWSIVPAVDTNIRAAPMIGEIAMAVTKEMPRSMMGLRPFAMSVMTQEDPLLLPPEPAHVAGGRKRGVGEQ